MIRDELTYRITGCAMKVYNTMGPGFEKDVYERCLAIELERVDLDFAEDEEHIIYYDGIDVGTRRADFIVENKIVVEVKALVNLEDEHLVQARHYIVAYDLPLGLLVNFGGHSLQHKLIFNPKYYPRENAVNSKSY